MMAVTIRRLSEVTSDLRILAKHPVRNEFSSCSTGNENGCYYSTKGHAVNAFDGRLQEHDLCLDRNDISDFHGDEGHKVVEIHDEFGHCAGHASISWYRTETGRYEFVGYIA